MSNPEATGLDVLGKQELELCPSPSWPRALQHCTMWRPLTKWAKPEGQVGNSSQQGQSVNRSCGGLGALSQKPVSLFISRVSRVSWWSCTALSRKELIGWVLPQIKGHFNLKYLHCKYLNVMYLQWPVKNIRQMHTSMRNSIKSNVPLGNWICFFF